MESFRIARAMQWTMRDKIFAQPDLFDVGCIAYDPDEPSKKVEPYYFDARRAPNAHSRDVGFAPNDLGMTTTAFPAVELLCLIGLQRGKPLPTDRPRIFHYHLWFRPIDPVLLPAAVAGLLPQQLGYEFESCFRTGQKKHKAFQSAKLKP
jgi:CRISPR-associated protein Csb3